MKKTGLMKKTGQGGGRIATRMTGHGNRMIGQWNRSCVIMSVLLLVGAITVGIHLPAQAAPGGGMVLDPMMEKLTAAMKEALADHERTTRRIANLADPKFQETLTEDELKVAGRRKALLEEAIRDLEKHSGRYDSLTQLLRAKAGMLGTVISQGRQ